MTSSADHRREINAARHACFVIQRNFGKSAFAPDPTLKPAVEAAEKRGWAQWIGPGRAVLTDDGLKEGLTYTGAR